MIWSWIRRMTWCILARPEQVTWRTLTEYLPDTQFSTSPNQRCVCAWQSPVEVPSFSSGNKSTRDLDVRVAERKQRSQTCQLPQKKNETSHLFLQEDSCPNGRCDLTQFRAALFFRHGTQKLSFWGTAQDHCPQRKCFWGAVILCSAPKHVFLGTEKALWGPPQSHLGHVTCADLQDSISDLGHIMLGTSVLKPIWSCFGQLITLWQPWVCLNTLFTL